MSAAKKKTARKVSAVSSPKAPRELWAVRYADGAIFTPCVGMLNFFAVSPEVERAALAGRAA